MMLVRLLVGVPLSGVALLFLGSAGIKLLVREPGWSPELVLIHAILGVVALVGALTAFTRK